jgi:hypothetical protein
MLDIGFCSSKSGSNTARCYQVYGQIRARNELDRKRPHGSLSLRLARRVSHWASPSLLCRSTSSTIITTRDLRHARCDTHLSSRLSIELFSVYRTCSWEKSRKVSIPFFVVHRHHPIFFIIARVIQQDKTSFISLLPLVVVHSVVF